MLALVSACALGLRCRYDGEAKPKKLPEGLIPIPVCPEQLGGLPTPRPKMELSGGDGEAVWEGKARVINERGEDVTEALKRGAKEALRLAKVLGIKVAFLQEKSPSCGVNLVWVDGKLVPGSGVAAALLRREGLEVVGI